MVCGKKACGCHTIYIVNRIMSWSYILLHLHNTTVTVTSYYAEATSNGLGFGSSSSGSGLMAGEFMLIYALFLSGNSI